MCVATASPDGGLDVSPRGDPAGFVRIIDERTLLLPDRPGNKLADTLTNLLADDRIALLFLIPGVGDSFRANRREGRDPTTPSCSQAKAPSTADRRASGSSSRSRRRTPQCSEGAPFAPTSGIP